MAVQWAVHCSEFENEYLSYPVLTFLVASYDGYGEFKVVQLDLN
jgi:hypothetical protein